MLNGCLRLQGWNSEVMDVQTERGNVSCIVYKEHWPLNCLFL